MKHETVIEITIPRPAVEETYAAEVEQEQRDWARDTIDRLSREQWARDWSREPGIEIMRFCRRHERTFSLAKTFFYGMWAFGGWLLLARLL